MKRLLVLLASALIAGPAWSTPPCRGSTQIGERIELALVAVVVDDEDQSDLSAYSGYDVSLRAEVYAQPVDNHANYVVFDVERVETATNGEQREVLGEFYSRPFR